jgi:hypothetical protein
MPDITSEIDAVLSDHSRFDAKQLDIIISFVNELDKGTLSQFETAQDRTIMNTYEQLLSASKEPARRRRDEEYELESLTGGRRRNATMSNHAEFFDRFKTSPAHMYGYGGNVYREQTKSYYDVAGKILAGLGGLASFGAGTAAIAASQAGSSLSGVAARYALSSVGATGLAAGAMALLRNNFSDVQVATNKDFLETVKAIAKLRNKLNDFFVSLNNKVSSDKAKAKTALTNEMSSHPLRFVAGSGSQVVRANLTPIEHLVTQDFININHDIRAKILPRGENSTWSVAVSSSEMGWDERVLDQSNMGILQQVVYQL